jgi:hypothetical protein
VLGLIKSAGERIVGWPDPTEDDVLLIGKIIVLYSHIDFNLRRMIECLDHAKVLPPQHLGKSARMHLSEIENILEAAPGATDPTKLVFNQIREHRKTRNLLAHFAIKRFPTEEPLMFVTKNAAD